jgi:hypothetical protein
MDNTPAAASITSVINRTQMGRTGVVYNSKFRHEWHNGSSWLNMTLRGPTTQWYSDDVSSHFNTEAKINAALVNWYYYFAGSTHTTKLFCDFSRLNVTYVLPAGESVITWMLPFFGAIGHLTDFRTFIDWCMYFDKYRRTGHLWEPWGILEDHEYALIERQMKECRNKTHFIKRNGVWLPTLSPLRSIPDKMRKFFGSKEYIASKRELILTNSQ